MKYSKCNKQSCAEPWRTPVYEAQCFTAKLAGVYANKHSNVSSFNSAFKPPFCLRVVKQYRTNDMQAFRDTIARIARNIRKCA